MMVITTPLDERQRSQAGLIYYEAFRRKLQPLIGKPAQTIPLLAAGLRLDMTIGALHEEKLLGLAGLHSQAGVFSQVGLRASVQALGLARGLYAWMTLNLFGVGAGCPADELRIAALAVDAAARGQGVGTGLLQAVFAKSRREGYRAVRLEVVGTNTGARQLYERLGFAVVKTHHYPFIRRWLGFSGEYVMTKEV